MKLKLMLAAVAMLASSAASADWVNYGKIEFQAGDKWVKAASLCVAGDQFFHADAQPKVSCQENGEGDCVRKTVFDAVFFQPMNSTRVRCDRREGDAQGGACLEWVEVDFIQTAMVKNTVYRSYSAYENGEAPIGTTYTVIPACPDGKVDAN